MYMMSVAKGSAAGHTGTMNNVVIKDIFDLDGLSSKEVDENGEYLDLNQDGIADYTTFCQTVDRNAGAAIINADLTVSNVLTQDVQGYGWSVIQANVALDTAFAQRNTCSSFLAFQGGIQGNNIEVASNNFEYDGLGSGIVGYSQHCSRWKICHFRTTDRFLDISAYLYDTTGPSQTIHLQAVVLVFTPIYLPSRVQRTPLDKMATCLLKPTYRLKRKYV